MGEQAAPDVMHDLCWDALQAQCSNTTGHPNVTVLSV